MAMPELRAEELSGTQTPIAEAEQTTVRTEKLTPAVKDYDKLRPLLTLAELQYSDETEEFWVAEIPSKMGDAILYCMRTAIPSSHGNHLQHIRRFVKPENLPKPLKSKVEAIIEKPPNPLYLVVCPTSFITEDALRLLFKENPSIRECEYDFKIYRVQIPTKAPVNPEQAASHSERFWPVVYRPGGMYGPHKSLFQRAQEVIAPTAASNFALAQQAAEAAKTTGIGEAVGAIIVSYNHQNESSVLALAGDARWCQLSKGADPSCGNVMAHAVIRAIGMIGRRRVHASGQEVDASREGFFFDQPITDVEREHHEEGELSQESYLCLGHTIFITHEPCVMCSMAILHSRFDRVVIGQRMLGTGGLTAEHILHPNEERPDAAPPKNSQKTIDALGYGLFYRPELNWKLLAWEWKDDEPKVQTRSTLHA